MPSFSKRSKTNLSQAHPDLQTLFNEVIKERDCSVICGERGEKAQNKAYAEGNSKKRYPDSKHNKKPSLAVDVVPWPLDWNDIKGFKEFGEYVMRVYERMWGEGKIKSVISWGGHWRTFKDYPHYEIA